MNDAAGSLPALARTLAGLLDEYRDNGEEALRRLDPGTDVLADARALLTAAPERAGAAVAAEVRRLLGALEAALVAAPHPLGDSYWVVPGRLLAGEYPGARDDAQARRQLRRLRWCGVTEFIDLTEPDEYGLRPYAPLLDGGARYRRFAIADRDVPGDDEMRSILDRLDAALAEGRTVYVHCFGGIGRTGTVIGCWLVRHGSTGADALRRIADLREGTTDSWVPSPETDEQRAFVRAWPERPPSVGS